MKKIQEIIVVEGKADTQNLQKYLDVDTIETNGSALDAETLRVIERAQASRGVIVLTDPDYPGQKIRSQINQQVPGVKHAFVDKEDCQAPNGGSLGIEHADGETIKKALSFARSRNSETLTYSRTFLADLGLLDRPGAREKREALGKALHIGHTNGKQLKKRLEMFAIQPQLVKEALKEIEGGDHGS